ncbi:MAG: META domain-containing protein [Bacteroidales bacterium]|jgi:putative lipoprotein|nr:META domain-containing protein [Bacteroidales bacterium]
MKRTTVIISIVIVVLLALSLTACMTAKKKAEMAKNKPLVETYWVLKSVKGEDIPKSFITPRIVFHADGRYTGNLGCNSFFGTYHCGKKKIKMSFEGATKRLCENMKVEKLFFASLHSEFTQYEIIEDTLILKDKNGEVLRFFAGVKPE